jgi:endonuclease V-like protein UPF0215 family
MSIWAFKNQRVRFTGENSTPFQENEAKKNLVVGQIYEVEKVIEGNWFSFLVLKGFDKKQFAIEMFEGLSETEYL